MQTQRLGHSRTVCAAAGADKGVPSHTIQCSFPRAVPSCVTQGDWVAETECTYVTSTPGLWDVTRAWHKKSPCKSECVFWKTF